jgi:hypothetical protein
MAIGSSTNNRSINGGTIAPTRRKYNTQIVAECVKTAKNFALASNAATS